MSSRGPHRTPLVAPGRALLGVTWLLASCAPGQDGVAPEAAALGALQQQFEREVLPVLEHRCATGCHGVPADAYRAFVEDPDNRVGLFFPIEASSGRVPRDPELRQRTYDVVRGAWPLEAHEGHGSMPPRIDHQAQPEQSGLLRFPLAASLGGFGHRGLEVFESRDDPDYQRIEAWVKAEIAAHPEAAPTLSRGQAFFGKHVVGVLERNGCFLTNCHGPNVFNDLKLVPPLPRTDHTPDAPARFSPRALAANREAVLGKVSRFVNLGGDLRRSRLIMKNLPIAQGGVHQRGGNQQFFDSYEDPDVKILLGWMRLEQKELAERLTSSGQPIPVSDLGRLQGVAFLRGPRHAPRRFFDGDAFWPGTELMLAPEGEPPFVLVGGPDEEIQAFDVRYDARAIVLSMRRRADEGFRIYELSLDADLRMVPGSLRSVTFGPARLADGTLVHHVDPIYAPGPDDAEGTALDDVAVVFASNQSGAYVASEPWALVGEADDGSSTTLVDRQRAEAPGTYDDHRMHIVDGPMRGQWRRIVLHEDGGSFQLDRALPERPDARTTYVIEQRQADYRPAYDIWRTIPGRPFGDVGRRMTFTAAQERRPTMRTTGEVMFTSVRNRGWQGDRPVFNGAIYRVMAGGFDYHIHGGNRSRHSLYADSRELPSGLEVRVATDPRNLWGSGALMLVDHGFGVNLEPDNPMDHVALASGAPMPTTASQRFLPTQLPLSPERGPNAITSSGVSMGGSFRDPFPLPDGTVMVAHTPDRIDHLDEDADPDWDLYQLRFARSLQSVDGLRAGEIELERLTATSSRRAETHPRPIMVRLKEHPRTHQKFVPGAEPIEVDGVLRMPADTPAEIECYDYPLLTSFLTSFAPVGARDFRSDELRFVRIVRQLPSGRADTRTVEPPVPAGERDPAATRVSMGVHQRSEIVAEVPLEPDGSFYAEVPAEVPLILQGLNADRMAVHSMNRWFYLQPGERLTFSIPRSIFPMRCAGCHGSLTGDRRDALGVPDVVSAASRVMATWSALDSHRRPPHPPSPMTIDYERDVQPIWDRHCTRCHRGESAAAELDLGGDALGPYSVSYVSLLALEDPESGDHARRRWIDEREALSSESALMELLSGRELRAEPRLDRPGLPHPEGQGLTPEELLTISRWIDLGATFVGAPTPGATP